MLRAVFSYSSSSKEFHTLLQLVWKKYTVLENDFYIMTCCRNYKVSSLPHEKPLSIKEIRSIFLHILPEYTFKLSRDSPPCYLGLNYKAVWGCPAEQFDHVLQRSINYCVRVISIRYFALL